jgi:asparagine synthase (glutamine-hydrolysing)
MALPSGFKLNGYKSKYILKKIMRNLLPEEVIKRPKKGFGIPIAKWIKGPLKDLFQDLLSQEKIKKEGFLNHEYINKVFEDHLRNKKDNRKKLWTLLIWELWVNRYNPSI